MSNLPNETRCTCDYLGRGPHEQGCPAILTSKKMDSIDTARAAFVDRWEREPLGPIDENWVNGYARAVQHFRNGTVRDSVETTGLPSLPDNPEALKRIVGRHVRWREKAMSLLKEAAFLERKPADMARLIEFIDQSESRLVLTEKTPETLRDVLAEAIEKHHSPEKASTSLDWLEGRDFYEYMQAYRLAPTLDQSVVIAQFEAVKRFIRSQANGK